MIRSFRSAAPLLLLAACGAPSSSVASLDTHPATIEEAKATAEQLELILAARPNDPEALAAQQAFHARLDELNHLVARIETSPGHVVSFFDTGNRTVAIQETRPQNEPSLVADADRSSPAALYRALAGGKEPPAALAALEPQLADATPEVLAPASGGAAGSRVHAEGNNITNPNPPPFTCYDGGDFYTCQPGWWNGGWWQKNAKTSFFEIQPLAGTTLYVEFNLSSGGGFFVPAPSGITHLWGTSPGTERPCSLVGCLPVLDYVINTHTWTLVNAANDEFNWSTEFRWTCTSQAACNVP